MKPLTRRLVYALTGVLAGSTVQMVMAETKPNPYQAIVERNPFGLKPPPPPPDPTPPAPAAPPAKVLLTGISSMFGVRALLEITEQEPGKSPTTRKPILKEGERDGSVEVLAIDVEKSLVKIRNAFETPKLTGAAGAPPGFPGLQGAFPPPLTTPVPGAPAVFTPGNANPAARTGPTVYGNTPAAATAVPRTGLPSMPDNSGLRSIPTRNVRPDGLKTYPPVPGR